MPTMAKWQPAWAGCRFESLRSPRCGARQKLRLSKQTCFLPTAAPRSPPFLRHRRRSGHSPMVGMTVDLAVAAPESLK